MITIYKFPLLVTDVQKIPMPAGAQILSCQVQRDTVCLWAMVDTERAKEERTVWVCGTGNPILEDQFHRLLYIKSITFVDTFQVGTLVFHVFISNTGTP